MEKEQKLDLCKILLAAALLVGLYFVPVTGLLRTLLYIIPYAIVGFEVWKEAGENLFHGELLDENFLMVLATVGAFLLGDCPEAVFVMLFFQVGELFEHLAEHRSRRSIASLMELRPDVAHVERDGVLTDVAPETLAVGEIFVVKPGEKLPVDGEVTEGRTTLDTAALTGESLPRAAEPGDPVLSGCINLTGMIRARVTKPYEQSTVAKILELVENAAAGKAKSETFLRRFARWYTPAVVAGAVLLAVVPSLITGDWAIWVHRALTFLVVSCPCALVVSVPLAFFGGIGGASRQGILIKGSGCLEDLARLHTVALDKTGTLTKGNFAVTGVCGEETVLLEYAALAESGSDHPVAAALRAACPTTPDLSRLGEEEESAGHGVRARVDGRDVLVGSRRLMEKHGVPVPPCEETGTTVHVAADGAYLGYITVADELKPDAGKTIRSLKNAGVERIVMLTGDGEPAAASVAATLGLTEYRAGLLPADKVTELEKLISEADGKVAFVGDGINDAPVLARADLGIAMGAYGSDAAMEAADVVLMEDRLSGLTKAITIAQKAGRIVRENLIFAIAVKLAILILGALGITGLGWTIFADVGVLILTVINAARTLGRKKV